MGGKIKTETILVIIPFLYIALITYEIALVVNQ